MWGERSCRRGGRRKKRLGELADHLIGYRTTAEPDLLQFGPQPYEGLVSEVCTAFGICPCHAETENYPLITAILDYRNAKHAIELMNRGGDGFDQLAKHPYLGELLLRMLKAQDVVMESPGEAIAAVADLIKLNQSDRDE